MDSMHFFEGRSIAIATMHAKEQVIAPRLSAALRLSCHVPAQLDTDLLGTFSGEVERLLSPLDAARAKCQLAMDLSSVDLAIASEGSFGAHPIYPFISAHEEILLLVDRKNQWEFKVKTLETDTNYQSWKIDSIDQLSQIVDSSTFPTHAVIVKKTASDALDAVKGIQSATLLNQTVHEFLQKYGSCQVETDMRAMHNPTRMRVIDALTEKLIQQISSTCPICSTPGFRISQVERGLPCELCDAPTQGILAEIFTCQACNYAEHRKNPDAHIKENPMFCDYCNP